MTSSPETSPIEHAFERARSAEQRYAGDSERPLGGYLAVLGTYGLTVAGFAALLRWKGRELPERFDTRDLALATLATHKLSRLLAKDPVTSPLRAPFTRFAGTTGPSELHEEVRGTGPQKAVGELLTCPFCIGHWVASAFAFGLVLAPRPTRVVASIYATLAGSDLLQYAYSTMQRRSGEEGE